MEENQQEDTIFSAKQRLTLQQLLTRQALSEQMMSLAKTSNDARVINEQKETPSTEDQSAHWRLIPDETKLHEWQEKCLTDWIGRGRGTIKVATGGGKTIFALAAAQRLQNTKEPDLRLAIIVPTIPLMHQWLDELSSTNIPREKIALMGGGESIPDDPDLRILICVINSARSLLPAIVKRFDWVPRLLLVIDECHRANASEAQKVFDAHPKYTLGLSATPESEAGDPSIPTDEAYARSEVGKGLGPIIFEFSLKESLEASLLTPFEVWHVGLPLNPEEEAQYVKLSREISDLRKDLQVAYRRSRSLQNFLAWCQTIASRKGGGEASRFIGMANERKRLLYGATSRSELTLNILSSAMRDADRRAIVFHEAIEEINKLFIAAIDRQIPAVLEHSRLPAPLRAGNINAFRSGIARTIISAKSLVEGFNVPSADLGIIAASSGSVRQRIQSLGRMLRKKASGSTAIIFVLYVKGTEDEAIYQKADWEAVVGAERNRYFNWNPETGSYLDTDTLDDLIGSFKETGVPPRRFRPACNALDTNTLEIGTEYPAQTSGLELRVDQAGNLRTDDKVLVSASKEAIEKIIETNQYRRAVRTPCGHLICRTGRKRGPEDIWIYLGNVETPKEQEESDVEKLTVKRTSGRRVISRKKGRNEVYARGPEKASSNNAGLTQKMLLEWVQKQEEKRSTPIRDLYWNFDKSFWIEVNGERIKFEEALSPLEFPQ